MTRELTVGFLPLVDACLPILAREHGFAEAEGLSLRLVRDVSWATVLDRLLYGHSDAAHLVAPLAIATTLGRGRPAQPLSVPFVLGLNGNAITMTTALAARVGTPGRLGDPAEVGARLAIVARERRAAGNPLRFGVVHRYSSHNYMLRYWLAATCEGSTASITSMVVAVTLTLYSLMLYLQRYGPLFTQRRAG